MIWQRPHPLTVLAELVQAIGQTIIPLVFILSSSGGSGGILDYAESLILIVPLGLALARWYSTRYALDDESVYLNSGIFLRSKQVLPRSNVQNLSTTAPLWARLTGLVELNISDASADGDIRLRLIERSEAERLTSLLRREVAQTDRVPVADGSPLPPPTTGPIGQQPDSTAAVAPSTSAIAMSAAATAGNGFMVIGAIGLWLAVLNWFDTGFLADVAPEQVAPWVWVLVVLAVVAGATALGVIGRVVTLGGFRLWDDPDRLRIRGGLLTERQITARRERIQLVRVNRPWLLRKIGMEEIKFSTADVESPQLAVMTYLDPAAQLSHWPALAPHALGRVELGEADLQQVSPLTKRRVFIRFAVLAAAVALIGLVVGLVWSYLAILTGASIGLLITAGGRWFSVVRYQKLGIAVGESQIFSRTGVLNEELILMRKEKIQGVVVSSTFFQRRLGLATLSVGTAGHGGQLGGMRVPDVPQNEATELATSLALHSSRTPLEHTL